MTEPLLATAFRFRVALVPSTTSGPVTDDPSTPGAIGRGGFQECTGLEVEMDVTEYPEGGRNDGLVQRAGRVKHPRLVLKRGMFLTGDRVDPQLWQWIADAVGGVRPIRRYDGLVWMLGAQRQVVATWTFRRALPAKVSGPQLNARTGEVAMEELHLAHEGLRLATS